MKEVLRSIRSENGSILRMGYFFIGYTTYRANSGNCRCNGFVISSKVYQTFLFSLLLDFFLP